MFFKNKQGGVAAALLTPPIRQKIEKTDFAGVELKEYVAVAEKVGFVNGAFLTAHLWDFFVEEGIGLYDYAKVYSFLTQKAKLEGSAEDVEKRIWCWKPLRKSDVNELENHLQWYENGHIARQVQYHGAVPYPVLLTVNKIVQRFGDQVHFYVSDYASKEPDPFLAVTGLGIGRWF